MRRPPLAQATPEARIAAVANNLLEDMLYGSVHRRRPPDFADFRDAFKAYMDREVLLARMIEASKLGRQDRVVALELLVGKIDLDANT